MACKELLNQRYIGDYSWIPILIFTAIERLGSGQYGIVSTCVHKYSGVLLACKTIDKEKLMRKKQIDSLKSEIVTLDMLAGHPNIVQQVGVYEDTISVHVVLELCRGGDLFDLVSKAGRLREIDAAWIFRKVVGAVMYCHSRKIIHRDIKPENILIAVDGSVEPKLADFGLATHLEIGQALQGLAGSPSYMAPEVILGDKYDFSADVWSLGIVLYFILSGKLPFLEKSPFLTFSAICKGATNLSSPPWTGISYSAKNLIHGILNHDPAKRPTLEEILDHPWILGFGPSACRHEPMFSPTVPCDLTSVETPELIHGSLTVPSRDHRLVRIQPRRPLTAQQDGTDLLTTSSCCFK